MAQKLIGRWELLEKRRVGDCGHKQELSHSRRVKLAHGQGRPRNPGLQRVQVHEQVVYLLIVQNASEPFHLAASIFDDLADALIVCG